MKKTLIVIGCIIILLCVAIFIWPTKYRYTKTTIKNDTYPVRINRISGKTEYYNISSGWIEPGKDVGLTNEEMFPELPPDERIKITGKGTVEFTNVIRFDLYNGSNCEIFELIFNIQKKDSKGTILWERKYKTDAIIKSLTAGTVQFEVADLEIMDIFDWSIVSAVGSR